MSDQNETTDIVAKLQAEREALAADRKALAQKLEEAEATIVQFGVELKEWKDIAASASGERDLALARVAELEKLLAARPKVAAPKNAAAKARKFGVILDDNRLDLADLRVALADGDEIEIALLDDRAREIPGSRPIAVSGDVWRDHARGLMLTEAVELRGPSDGPGYAIAGYALVIDGKHVATAMRAEPFAVTLGSQVKLVDDIIF